MPLPPSVSVVVPLLVVSRIEKLDVNVPAAVSMSEPAVISVTGVPSSVSSYGNTPSTFGSVYVPARLLGVVLSEQAMRVTARIAERAVDMPLGLPRVVAESPV